MRYLCLITLLLSFSVHAQNLQKSQWAIEEKGWDKSKPLVFGRLESADGAECGDVNDTSDKWLSFNIGVFSSLAGDSFDVDKIYVDGIGTGESALNAWKYSFSIKPSLGNNVYTVQSQVSDWSSLNIKACVGSIAQSMTTNKALENIAFWYDGDINTANVTPNVEEPEESDGDNGSDASDGNISSSDDGVIVYKPSTPSIQNPTSSSTPPAEHDITIKSGEICLVNSCDYRHEIAQTLQPGDNLYFRMRAEIKNKGDVDEEDIDIDYRIDHARRFDKNDTAVDEGKEDIDVGDTEKDHSDTIRVQFDSDARGITVYNADGNKAESFSNLHHDEGGWHYKFYIFIDAETDGSNSDRDISSNHSGDNEYGVVRVYFDIATLFPEIPEPETPKGLSPAMILFIMED